VVFLNVIPYSNLQYYGIEGRVELLRNIASTQTSVLSNIQKCRGFVLSFGSSVTWPLTRSRRPPLKVSLHGKLWLPPLRVMVRRFLILKVN
jgi:hypothetical protein